MTKLPSGRKIMDEHRTVYGESTCGSNTVKFYLQCFIIDIVLLEKSLRICEEILITLM